MAVILSLLVYTIIPERWLRIEFFVDRLIKNRHNKIPLRNFMIEYLNKLVDLRNFTIKTIDDNYEIFEFLKKENNQYYEPQMLYCFINPQKNNQTII